MDLMFTTIGINWYIKGKQQLPGGGTGLYTSYLTQHIGSKQGD